MTRGTGRPGWCWVPATFDQTSRRHQVERLARLRTTQTNLEPKEPNGGVTAQINLGVITREYSKQRAANWLKPVPVRGLIVLHYGLITALKLYGLGNCSLPPT